jgi:hypothetical protein
VVCSPFLHSPSFARVLACQRRLVAVVHFQKPWVSGPAACRPLREKNRSNAPPVVNIFADERLSLLCITQYYILVHSLTIPAIPSPFRAPATLRHASLRSCWRANSRAACSLKLLGTPAFPEMSVPSPPNLRRTE